MDKRICWYLAGWMAVGLACLSSQSLGQVATVFEGKTGHYIVSFTNPNGLGSGINWYITGMGVSQPVYDSGEKDDAATAAGLDDYPMNPCLLDMTLTPGQFCNVGIVFYSGDSTKFTDVDYGDWNITTTLNYKVNNAGNEQSVESTDLVRVTDAPESSSWLLLLFGFLPIAWQFSRGRLARMEQ